MNCGRGTDFARIILEYIIPLELLKRICLSDIGHKTKYSGKIFVVIIFKLTNILVKGPIFIICELFTYNKYIYTCNIYDYIGWQYNALPCTESAVSMPRHCHLSIGSFSNNRNLS